MSSFSCLYSLDFSSTWRRFDLHLQNFYIRYTFRVYVLLIYFRTLSYQKIILQWLIKIREDCNYCKIREDCNYCDIFKINHKIWCRIRNVAFKRSSKKVKKLDSRNSTYCIRFSMVAVITFDGNENFIYWQYFFQECSTFYYNYCSIIKAAAYGPKNIVDRSLFMHVFVTHLVECHHFLKDV